MGLLSCREGQGIPGCRDAPPLASLGLGTRRTLWLATCNLHMQLLDLHHQQRVAVPIDIDLTMLTGIMASTLIMLRNFVRLGQEVLRLLPLAHLAVSMIMVMMTFWPLADVPTTVSVRSAVFLLVCAGEQRRSTLVVLLFPLAGYVHLASGLHAVHLCQYAVYCLYSNL